MPQELTEQQKILLREIAAMCKNMETHNDLQYALKGLLTEVCHIITPDYFDPVYITQKAEIITQCLEK